MYLPLTHTVILFENINFKSPLGFEIILYDLRTSLGTLD